MTPLRNLRAVLHRAAERDAPPVDADFANQLEARLRVLASGPVPQGSRLGHRATRRPWTTAGAIAVAAASIAAVLISQAGDRTNQVTTLPGITTTTLEPTTEVPTTSSTTTSAPPATATTVTAPPVTAASTTTTTARPRATTTTTSTTAVPVTTTTEKPTVTLVPTTTTVKPTTTTSTTLKDGQQNLALECRSTGTLTSPAITCRWAQSTSPSFTNYILKRKMDEQQTNLLETPDRSRVEYVDTTPRLGATITYGVMARDKSGTILGQGQATVTCC